MNKRVFPDSVLCLLFILAIASAADWPGWRGPAHNGMAIGDAPLNWSDSQNIKWRTAIPGRGHSSPIVWGDKVFLTTAIPTTAAPAEESRRSGGPPSRPGGPPPRGGGLPPPKGGPPSLPQVEHEFVLLCLERGTGRVLWQRTAVKAVPHQGHRPGEGTFANESPVTDGHHVIAYFGSRGIFCYDLSGNLVWKKDLGVKLDIFHEYGEGTSPVLDGNMLLIKADHEGTSFFLALNKNTGEQIWRVARDERTSFSVPLVVTYQNRKQIITAATKRIRAYDYETGNLIWECGGLGMNSIPAPVSANGIVYAMTGYQEPKLMAIRLGGKGDITGSNLVLWSTTRDTAYVPSPLLNDNRLYVVRDGGFISAYNATTGTPVYQSVRLPVGHTFKSSPVGVNGKIYLASEQDDVIVLKMGDKPDVLAVNTLKDQVFVASPAIVDGEIFLRGSSTLFCISARTPAAGVKPGAATSALIRQHGFRDASDPQ
jgi:outer membrane protein assembly factor BamB